MSASIPTTGSLVICKVMSGSNPEPLQGTALLSFTFDVGGQSVIVDECSCSSPIALPAGSVVVTEFDVTPEPETGTLLTSVTSDPEGAVSAVDLVTRTATLTITAGRTTTVRFTNELLDGFPSPERGGRRDGRRRRLRESQSMLRARPPAGSTPCPVG